MADYRGDGRVAPLTPRDLHHLRDLLTAALGYTQLIHMEIGAAPYDGARVVARAEKVHRYLTEMDHILAHAMGVTPTPHGPRPDDARGPDRHAGGRSGPTLDGGGR